MKERENYLNFMGDTQNYKFYGPLPNPYGLRGNPDTQANCEQGGDGLNGYYRNFGGNERDTTYHVNFFGSRDPEVDMTGWTPEQIMEYENQQAILDEQKREKRQEWWTNAGQDFGSLVNQFANTYTDIRSANQPQIVQPMGPNYTPTTPNPYGPPPPAKAGLDTGSVIGIVLVASLVIGGLVYVAATSGRE